MSQPIFEAVGEILKAELSKRDETIEQLQKQVKQKQPETSLIEKQLEQKCEQMIATLTSYRRDKANIVKHGLPLVSKGLSV